MSRSTHDDGVLCVVHELLRRGHRVAFEVGIPGGRLDVAVLDEEGICWALEVKVRAAEQGVPQLIRYADNLGRPVRLTLVVPGELDTPELREVASTHVEVWPWESLELSDETSAEIFGRKLPGDLLLQLPYIHESSFKDFLARRAAERSVA